MIILYKVISTYQHSDDSYTNTYIPFSSEIHYVDTDTLYKNPFLDRLRNENHLELEPWVPASVASNRLRSAQLSHPRRTQQWENNCWFNTITTLMCSNGPVKEFYKEKALQAINAINEYEAIALSLEMDAPTLAETQEVIFYDDRDFLTLFLEFQNTYSSENPIYTTFRTALLQQCLNKTPSYTELHSEYDSSEVEHVLRNIIMRHSTTINEPIGYISRYFKLPESALDLTHESIIVTNQGSFYKTHQESYHSESIVEGTLYPFGADTIFTALTESKKNSTEHIKINDRKIIYISEHITFEGPLPKILTIKEVFPTLEGFLAEHFEETTSYINELKDAQFISSCFNNDGSFNVDVVSEKILILETCSSTIQPNAKFGHPATIINNTLSQLSNAFADIISDFFDCLSPEVRGIEHIKKSLNKHFKHIQTCLSLIIIHRQTNLELIAIGNDLLPGFTTPTGEQRLLLRLERRFGSSINQDGHWNGIILKSNEKRELYYTDVDLNFNTETPITCENVIKISSHSNSQNTYTFCDPKLIFS